MKNAACKFNHADAKKLFVDLCHKIDDYARENCPEVPRTVEEIEALAYVSLASFGMAHGGPNTAAEGLVESAKGRLAVPVAERTVCV
jgi:hypothetical protein